MKQHIVRILVAFGLVLSLVLAWLWIGTDGKPRNVHWIPPLPHKPDFAGMIPHLPLQDPADLNRFVATLDRPLFSPSRRPPPPPPPPVVAPPPPPPDPLANIHLFGVFAGEEGTGGIIARIDGKPRRVGINERIGAWKITGIENRDVTLVRGDETRVLNLVHAKVIAPAATAAGANPDAAAAPPPTTARGARSDPANFARDRAARINAARAQAGRPPRP